jgi:PAS domain S-box-containing protein
MSSDAILLLDETSIIECNRDAEEIFGAGREWIIGSMPYELSPETQPDGSQSREIAIEKVRLASAGNSQFFEWKHRKFDGTLFDTEVSLNRIIFEGRPVILAIIRDITERKKMEDAGIETEQMFRAIVENSHAGIFTIDDTFRITYANDMAGKMLLRTNDEIIGHDFREMLDEESVMIVSDNYLRRRMGGETPARYEFNIVQKDGNKRRVEISSTIYRTASGGLRTVGQVLDITERKKAQDELILALKAREQAAANERNRLARDLHDAVSQTLFSASLIADVLPRLWERDEAEGRKRLEEVRQLTKGALAEMRTLLLELRPAALVEADLSYLLKQLGESITGRSRIPVTVLIQGEYPLPEEVKIALYRIAQESMNNMARHSAAKAAKLTLLFKKNRVTLEVSDDGHGFDMKTVYPDSFGLGIMRERARQIGAQLSVQSKTGGGTRIKILWNKKPAEVDR